MKDGFDLVTIGDSTIDTFIKIHDAEISCSANHEDCKICLPYGSKVPVDSIAFGVAGDAANVAVGTARLGLSTAIYTNLGDDEHGGTILEAFKKEGVDTKFVNIEKNKKSNLSVVLTFAGERTIFVYHQNWFYKLPQFGFVSWIYLTSLSESFTNSNIMDEVYHFASSSGAKLAFGPGTYQLKANIKRYPKLLESCQLLIVNKEEAKRILGTGEDKIVEPADLLARLLFLGPKNVVITDGEHGSYATDGRKSFKLGILPVEVVEKTGAGDAYTSGLLAALIGGRCLAEAMVWGTVNASFEVQHVGTQVGLLSLSDLEKEMRLHTQFLAVEF